MHVLRGRKNVEVVGLFTTINEKYDRVAMHGVRSSLLRQQGECARLPLHVITIPDPCSDEKYTTVMKKFIEKAATLDVECMGFGDLYPDKTNLTTRSVAMAEAISGACLMALFVVCLAKRFSRG